MSNDEEGPVGRGRPPVKSRYPKGRSGNPRGRPKGSKNRKTVLREIAAETHHLTIDGVRRELPVYSLLLTRLHQAAVGGDRLALVASEEFRNYLSPEPQTGGGVIVFPEEPASLDEFEREAKAYRAVMLKETEAFRREVEGEDEDGET